MGPAAPELAQRGIPKLRDPPKFPSPRDCGAQWSGRCSAIDTQGHEEVHPQEGEAAIKLNSISGLTCYVEDLSRTAEFYDTIGFRRGKEEPDRVTFYVNWFFVTFIAQDAEADVASQKEAERPDKGAGLFLCIKVDDVDAAHEAVLANGLEPDGAPQLRASGNREFVLRDPDGYKLLFFHKK